MRIGPLDATTANMALRTENDSDINVRLTVPGSLIASTIDPINLNDEASASNLGNTVLNAFTLALCSRERKALNQGKCLFSNANEDDDATSRRGSSRTAILSHSPSEAQARTSLSPCTNTAGITYWSALTPLTALHPFM